jgi:hypothetical protein
VLVPPEAGELLAALDRRSVPHVVVGGVAVNLLGYERMTADVDVLVPASRAQGEAIQAFLLELGATRPDGSPLPDLLFDGEHHIRALTPFGIIDFIPEGASPLTFAEVSATARYDDVHGTIVRRADLAHMVAFKRLAGRPQDLQDLAMLAKAHGDLPRLPLPGEGE